MSTQLINLLVRRYGEPSVADPKFFIDTLKTVTSAYDDDLAERAFQILVTGRKYSTFPSEGDVLESLKKAHAEVHSDRDKPKLSTVQLDMEDQAKRFAADWLKRDRLGRLALIEGWGRQLRNDLIQKFKIAKRYGVLDLSNIEVDPARIAAYRKQASNKCVDTELLDLSVIFGSKDEAEHWQRKLKEIRQQNAARKTPSEVSTQ
ncbi:MAG: hypothetical protein RIC14_00150 [Filomicrobium sp.]